ncbi:snoRNA-binding protein [Mycoemilia scoparia]|uniref:H/ACA ribonucleoprotein complex subunit 2 n=1 Tax=Mycoemilia scoparia TaxID=417184 RepID=A0A9W7ZHN7_9FUNG|nr:snoRNA-binding protein [Mycoemilia scoparia]
MGKSSKEKRQSSIGLDSEADFNPDHLAPIAHPLADKKLTKKVFKTLKKATKHKHVKRGVKEVIKGIRKGDKGLVILAGNTAPIDVISHIPVLCEDKNIPYCFVPSRQELGKASSTKRPTSCVMVIPGGKSGKGEGLSDYKENYTECFDTVNEMNKKLITGSGIVA